MHPLVKLIYAGGIKTHRYKKGAITTPIYNASLISGSY